ncbi:hypothetical protein AB0K18_11895 [Nonomuraea sp. NPDC049421]|uniref:sunset domain-containing protein n=1 Tax=Nonomuraea sp. NPDC049421 TaxID=3155275 RepID=UPI003419BE30
MRSYLRASAWLAAFVAGVPALWLVAVVVALRGRPWVAFVVPYLGLFGLAFLVGLIPLALLRFRPDWLRALAAAAVVYALASFTPVIAEMTRYPYHVVRCGGLPVVASGFMAAMTYNVPGDEFYATPLQDRFFCTKEEARAAGYRHYP